MVDRIAVKLLRDSDLTFFDTFYKQSNVGNQKSINLNADIFIRQFYPSLGERSVGVAVEVPVAVTVYGPGLADAYRFTRSITKGLAYKNWRLNGAALPDPEAEPGRFGGLQPGDFAVIEFNGEAEPRSVRMVVVARASDPALIAELTPMIPGGRRTMVSVSRHELAGIATRAGLPPNHPFRVLLLDAELEEAIEEAAFGSEPAARRLRERKGRSISEADLLAARERASRIGAEGEALGWIYLQALSGTGQLKDLRWSTKQDAAASWDYECSAPDGSPLRIDAKSTAGEFERVIHISGAEIAAAASGIPYRILRIYRLTEEGAVARLSDNICDVARQVVGAANALPKGILPTGFSIDPHAFKWGPEVVVERPDDPE